MEIGKLASIAFNGAVPVVGIVAGGQVTRGFNEETLIPFIIGSALFGIVTGFGPGRRSHRYVGGLIAQIVPIFLGATLPPSKFDEGTCFVALGVSILAQIVLRELAALPFQVNQGGSALPESEPSIGERTSGEDTGTESGSGASGGSQAIQVYGATSSSTSLLPAWRLGEGQSLQSLGSVVTRVEVEEETERDLLKGDTLRQRRVMHTSDGGRHEQNYFKWTGWTGSKERKHSDYHASSGSMSSGASSSVPVIEDIDE